MPSHTMALGNGGGYIESAAVGDRKLSKTQHDHVGIAHAAVATLAFVAIYPIGAIIVRVADFPGLLWVHAALQGLGTLFFIIALGLGVMLANYGGEWNNTHPIIGILLFVMLLLQPPLGILHHKLYKKYGRRTVWSYAHLTIGRIAIFLGMVNGGLGLRLAGASRSAYIAYGVITAIVGSVYIATIVFGERKRISKA